MMPVPNQIFLLNGDNYLFGADGVTRVRIHLCNKYRLIVIAGGSTIPRKYLALFPDRDDVKGDQILFLHPI